MKRISLTLLALVFCFSVTAHAGLFSKKKEDVKTNQQPEVKSASAPLPSSQSQVAAKVGDKTITMAELDEAAKKDLAPLAAQIYQAKKNRLDQMIQEALYALEAKAQNKSVDQLKTEARKVETTVSDDAIEVYFDSNQQKYQGKTLDQVKEEIRQQLVRQRTDKAGNNFLSELKKKYATQIFLEEPKVTIKTEGAPSRGPKDAKVTIVEFSEFQCPFCKKFKPTVDQLVKEYPNDVRHVYYHNPLAFHDKAKPSSKASICADKQGKFWEYRDAAFEGAPNLDDASLKNYAQKVGLDMALYEACIKDPATDKKLEEDVAYAASVGARGTPTSFINGVLFSGARPYEELKKIVDQKLGK